MPLLPYHIASVERQVPSAVREALAAWNRRPRRVVVEVDQCCFPSSIHAISQLTSQTISQPK